MKGARPLTGEEVLLGIRAMRGRLVLRNRAMFVLGINTGFRISELLSLRLGDVLNADGSIKERITVAKRNMKGKRESRTMLVNEQARLMLSCWLAEMKQGNFVYKDDFVFRSIRGRMAIQRVQAWKVVHGAIVGAGLQGRFGTHCMRKTFANAVYQYFKEQAAKGMAVDAFRATSKALGHLDIKSTDQYLSFLTEEVDEAVENVGLWMADLDLAE